MTTAKTTASINQRIVAARANFKPITKDSVNPHFKNRYASLDHIIDCIEQPLAEQNVFIQHVADVTPTGIFLLRTRLVCVDSGEYVESLIPITIGKPQDQGSAITYARRYSLTALLNLCTETDDDGNQGSGNNQKASSGGSSKATTKQPPNNESTDW